MEILSFSRRLALAFLMVIFAGAIALAAPAPTKAELEAAKSAVEGLIETGMAADDLLRTAGESNSAAERYYLYRGAFALQMKRGEFDAAAETLTEMQSRLPFVSAGEVVQLIEKHGGKKSQKNAKLVKVVKAAKLRVSAEQQVVKLRGELKKNPEDRKLRRSYAEMLAFVGDWPEALKEFAQTGGEAGKAAEKESGGALDAALAAFWWDYTPRNKAAASVFRAHSAALYRRLLDKGGLSGVEKVLAERRVDFAADGGAEEAERSVAGGGDRGGAPAGGGRELSRLKRVCSSMKGLVHCWRFNGDLKDCVGGKDATASGAIVQSEREVTFPERGSAAITLGPDLFDHKQPVTFEIWATQLGVRRWARILHVGTGTNRGSWNTFQIVWTNGTDFNRPVVSFDIGNRTCVGATDGLAPYTLGTEFHIGVVLEQLKDRKVQIRVYQQDAKTGRTLCHKEAVIDNLSMSDLIQSQAWIGHSAYGDEDSYAAYNEVRVWSRALTEKELTDNARKFHNAGETRK